MHDVSTDQVSLVLRVARELHENRAGNKLSGYVGQLCAGASPDQSADDPEPHLSHRLLAGHVCAVTHDHVSHLVGHHAGKLRFVVRSLNGAEVYVQRTTWDSKRVDVFL